MSKNYKQIGKYVVSRTLLGRGSFGDVYKGFLKEDETQLVAVKVIQLDRISSESKFLELLKREIEIMQQIKHINIVRMYDASKTHKNLYMFLEFCQDGDLKQFLKKHEQGRIDEQLAMLFLKQIIEGFKELNSRKIIHRDIKPANILLSENMVKITDFGFARTVSSCMEQAGLFSNVGTPLYMCPQILNNQKFSAKCDIWSLGVIFYEMLNGHTPWTANSPYQLY